MSTKPSTSNPGSQATKARTALPFDFTPEAKERIRKRNAEYRAKGLPLWTPGAFGGWPLFPELRTRKAVNEAVRRSSAPEHETVGRPEEINNDGE